MPQTPDLTALWDMDDLDFSRPSQLASAWTVAISGGVMILATLFFPKTKESTRLVTIAPLVAIILSRIWVHVASHFVPEPYLVSITSYTCHLLAA